MKTLARVEQPTQNTPPECTGSPQGDFNKKSEQSPTQTALPNGIIWYWKLYGRIPLLYIKELTGSELKLYTVFSFMQGRGNKIYPSIATIRKWSGLSKKGFYSALNGLKKDGIIATKRRYSKSNLYYIRVAHDTLYGAICIDHLSKVKGNGAKVLAAIQSIQGNQESTYTTVAKIADRAGLQKPNCSREITKLEKLELVNIERTDGLCYYSINWPDKSRFLASEKAKYELPKKGQGGIKKRTIGCIKKGTIMVSKRGQGGIKKGTNWYQKEEPNNTINNTKNITKNNTRLTDVNFDKFTNQEKEKLSRESFLEGGEKSKNCSKHFEQVSNRYTPSPHRPTSVLDSMKIKKDDFVREPWF